MQGSMKKSRFLTNISRYLRNDASYSHRLVTMEGELETVCKLSNGANSNDLE